MTKIAKKGEKPCKSAKSFITAMDTTEGMGWQNRHQNKNSNVSEKENKGTR